MTDMEIQVQRDWMRAICGRTLALLRRVEWASNDQYCPECGTLLPCGNPEPGHGHAPDCELAALIRELEGRPTTPAGSRKP